MSTVWMSYTADGELTEHDTKATLQDMQSVVGGWIEPVTLHDFTVMVNEEGLLLGLPLNLGASGITGRPLVGDVCFVGNPDNYGNTKKLRKDTVERIRYTLTGR
jgi:Domain of unknown function (DUF3846)